ncbi:DUF4276 family protein [Streptomyces ipomoeae]|jgi:hypothetical protein|uniref:DUF4276 family protein n=3 Tax=Streptomyces ipomoeae TaxID=103232 RepID=L1KWX3_9ACTN|nr:hypothetical protein STRIP9103_04398 [Streptomyces ipomoeae 91-03]TQE20892.1 DUF4276 family protein [Streptomyces ipomoeae]TQE35682.1 DUF4276 family protein [Streptomyces ipomoeae]
MIALLAEGPSDPWFLLPLINRQVEALATDAAGGFDFGDAFRGECFTVAPREQVLKEVESLLKDMDLVIIHHDHNERGKVESLQGALSRPQDAERVIGIVPVRETEAWMLADPAALPEAPASVVRDLVRSPREVEKVTDPKKILAQAFGPRHRPERDFDRLGQHVSLDMLRQVPAYDRWVRDLHGALERLRFL